VNPRGLPTLAGCIAFALGAASAQPAVASDWREGEAARARLHMARMVLLERNRALYYGDVSEQIALERALFRDAHAAWSARTPPPVRTGFRLEAYDSMIDGSPQPFWRYLPPTWSATNPAPLLVFLHGYDPGISLVNVPGIPFGLTNVADRAGACMVAPFGRSNTDFQGIGEQDVVIVMEEMARRFGCDRERVVLCGYSMGGMGAWCMGARMPHLFNAILVVSGRGDFYVWHRLAPADVPPWQGRLVDTQFASAWLHQMTATPLLGIHGTRDDLVSFDQGRAIFDRLRPHNPWTRFIALPEAGHFIFDFVENNPQSTGWLHMALTRKFAKSPASRVRPGETGSRLQDAFLRPFLFVGAGTNTLSGAARRLRQRADEWRRFAQGEPRQMFETQLVPAQAALYNLFIFGEPEESPLVRRVLEAAGAVIFPDRLTLAGRDLPRAGHGLWLTGQNPFNTNRTAVVQCGLNWGQYLSDNHRYDRIPDVIVYGSETDICDVNLAVAAGFLDASGRIVWSDPPVTPGIMPRPSTPWRVDLNTPERTSDAHQDDEEP